LERSLGALSPLQVPCSEEMKAQFNADALTFTLVDCPGHASLIRTVLLGAQILDVMLLVQIRNQAAKNL